MQDPDKLKNKMKPDLDKAKLTAHAVYVSCDKEVADDISQTILDLVECIEGYRGITDMFCRAIVKMEKK